MARNKAKSNKPKLYTVAEATAITNFPGGSIKFFAWLRDKTVSYTHLTLPTKRIV